MTTVGASQTAVVGMVCITAVAVAKLVVDGDGSVLTAAISAIAALAGVEVGIHAKTGNTQDV